MLDPQRYNDLLLVESAGKLSPQQQSDLDLVRKAGAVPALDGWGPEHPYIAKAESRYGLPTGSLRALASVESQGNPDAVSPTGVTGLFQVTLGTGKRYGLTATNRTNPYLNTNGAAQHLSDLLGQYGDLDKALLKYKGPDVNDPAQGQTTHAEYLRRYHDALGKFGGGTAVAAQTPSPVQPQPAAPTAAGAPPAPAETAEAPGFGRRVLQRAGFGQSSDAPVDTGSGLWSVLGRTLENLNAGPMGPLLRTLELPAATGGQAVESLTGSPSAGTATQLILDLAGPKLATAVGSRALARVLPRETARTFVPRAAARLDVRDARRLVPPMEARIGQLAETQATAAQGARAASGQAVALGEQARAAAQAPVDLPATLGAMAPAARAAADEAFNAGIASQRNAAEGLSRWRVVKKNAFDTVERIAGDAPVIDNGAMREAMTAHGYATVTDDGLDLLTTGLGLTPEGRAILTKSFNGPLTFREARQLQTEIGAAAFRGAKPIADSPLQGLAKSFYSALGRGIDDFLTAPAGADVAPALAEAKQIYSTGKTLFNEGARRLVTGGRKAPKAPESVVDTVFAPGKITDTLDYKQLVGDETYTTAVQAWLGKVLTKAGGASADAQSLAKAFQPYLDSGHLEVILQPEQARLLRWELAQGLERAGEPARAAAILGEQAAQARGTAQTLGATAQAAKREAGALKTKVGVLERAGARGAKRLAQPTMTRKLLKKGGKAALTPLGLGALAGGAAAGAYYGTRK